MMLINPEAIKAHPISQFELIKVIVIEPVAELGIVQITRDINPDTTVLFLEIFGQEAVGHQMKPGKLHDASPLGISFKLRAPALTRMWRTTGKPGANLRYTRLA